MPTPVVNAEVKAETRHSANLHVHAAGQFTYVQRGVLSVQVGDRIWAVSDQQLYWMPPGIEHGSSSSGPVHFWLLAASDALLRLLPSSACVLNASALLVASLDRLRIMAPDAPLNAALMNIVLHEITTIQSEPPGITLPTSPRLRHWALSYISAPNVKMDIDAAAAVTAMSRRSFTRHFTQEVGVTFSVWQRRVMVHQAIILLGQGEEVSTIAYQLGYDSVSAFIAMFKAARGTSPHAWRMAQR